MNLLKKLIKHPETYKTIKIGETVWMAKNLNVSHYRNGDPIPQVQADDEWRALETGAWCYYENKAKNEKTYGKLYNWYATNDARGLAPKGWHIPTDKEWSQLYHYLGDDAAGGKMKSRRGWEKNLYENGNGTNESGFKGLPGGMRDGDRGGGGYFQLVGKYGAWWSSTEEISGASFHQLKMDAYPYCNDVEKQAGASVRCVKD